MTTPGGVAPRNVAGGELAFALGTIALGLFTGVQTALLPVAPGYDRIGPTAFPWAVAAALIAIGGVLAWQAATGRWHVTEEDPAFLGWNWRAFAWVSTGVLAHLALLQAAGFIIASAVLFAIVARGFGSRTVVRDGLIGIGLAIVIYAGFTWGLDLDLPAGLHEGWF